MNATETLVARLATLQEQQTELANQIEETKLQIAELLPKGGKIGDIQVQVSYPCRLDTKKITAAYPVIEYPELYEPKISTARVREQFSPIELLEYETQATKPIVVLR